MWLANRRIVFGARGTSAGTLGPIGQQHTHHDKERDSDNNVSNYHSSTRRFKSHYIMYNDLTLKENHYSLTPLELDGFSVKK